jgi:hypothetical protein
MKGLGSRNAQRLLAISRAPIPARVDFRVRQTGLGWRVEVSGLVDGQRRVREMLWNGATFVDARGWPQ